MAGPNINGLVKVLEPRASGFVDIVTLDGRFVASFYLYSPGQNYWNARAMADAYNRDWREKQKAKEAKRRAKP